ncbi:MAG: DUF4325 domain-containing protein [Methanobacteriaceae archaeon]|jgi:hypothetical protein|nr:DUF4325 domain-containing protein [Candidatus Methanorudis spinitermitis]
MISRAEVKIEQEIHRKLGMRSTAEDFFNSLNINVDEIVIDFDNVDFMSRSFAQEYVYQKRKADVKIIEKNTKGIVKDMLNTVENDYNENFGIV